MREDMLALTHAVLASCLFGGVCVLLHLLSDLAILAVFGEIRQGKDRGREFVRETLTLLFFIGMGVAIPVFLYVYNDGILRLPMALAFLFGYRLTRRFAKAFLYPLLTRGVLWVRHAVGIAVRILFAPLLALLSLLWKYVTAAILRICLRVQRRYDTIRIGRYARKKERNNADEMRIIYRTLTERTVPLPKQNAKNA